MISDPVKVALEAILNARSTHLSSGSSKQGRRGTGSPFDDTLPSKDGVFLTEPWRNRDPHLAKQATSPVDRHRLGRVGDPLTLEGVS